MRDITEKEEKDVTGGIGILTGYAVYKAAKALYNSGWNHEHRHHGHSGPEKED